MRFLSIFGGGVIGFGVALVGFNIYTTGGWYSGKFYYYSDYGDSSKPIGLILLIIGVYICIQTIMGIKKQRKNTGNFSTCSESGSREKIQDLK